MTALRALLSVSDKTGIVELARELVGFGYQLVSTGKTAGAIKDAGLSVTDVATVTGFPEILDGRVKTLHPKIFGGILADKQLPKHMAELAEHGIETFELVVVDLYPFDSNPSIELIDVGGPSVIRGAAKNYESVIVISNPSQYEKVLKELRENDGTLSLLTRIELAINVFDTTSQYDENVADWLNEVRDQIAASS